ncbi:MAG: ribonuclease III [Phormidesmis sp.]
MTFSLPSFNSASLWQQAMTHSSYANEHPNAGEHNERLEFLGDAILTFLAGEYLYSKYPQKPEGELTAIRAELVKRSQLCQFAKALELGKVLRFGKGAAQSGRRSSRLLCSAFEAMIGAYFLDTGRDMQAVSAYVLPMFDKVIEDVVKSGDNAKSRLQAWAQANFGVLPDYRVVGSSGPDHAKQHEIEVYIEGKSYGKGHGCRKQDAEKAAAASALIAIDAAATS